MKSILFLFLILKNVVASGDAPYNPTPNRIIDVLHSIIDISIDLEAQKVDGKVTHILTPLNSNLKGFDLDSEDSVIRRIRLNDKDIPFFQSEKKVHLSFHQSYDWSDTLKVEINYTSHPKTGLYFFKPDSIYPKRRLQAWTQGEETDNHHWVPIYDYPNDRATFECILTVDGKLKAISNGELVSTKNNKDGSKTFHWRENFPMVSYLISFAVGDYVKVVDDYQGLSVNYWVYPENKNEALRSFGKTPNMIKFFNEITGISYPFEKYDQIILTDFMFGGMENITLTHNTDKTMHDERSSPDYSSDGLVAHELAHQWYGDMITTKNWANIWLNEGFATYFSRLFITKDIGKNEGAYLRLSELRSYKTNDKSNRRPTVQYNYFEPFELFDSHVYSKGSLILEMLKEVLGEDSFWRSIQHYTKTNKFKIVETKDLEQSIEEITGQNLDWFFKQWVYEAGYPEYSVKWTYNQRTSKVRMKVSQLQASQGLNLFKMPIRILVDSGKKEEHVVWIEDKETLIELHSNSRPKMVIFNSGSRVPCLIKENKSVAALKYQLKESSNIIDRISAAEGLAIKKGRKIVEFMLLESVKNDTFWAVRKEAALALAKLKPTIKINDFDWINNEKDTRVKRATFNILKNYKNEKRVSEFLESVIKSDTNYYVVADAYKALVAVDSLVAKQHIQSLINTDSHNDVIRIAVLDYFRKIKSEKNMNKLKELASYKGFSWDARPYALKYLATYIKDYPQLVKYFENMKDDNNRFIRQQVITQLGYYGDESHFNLFDEIVLNDPVLSIYSRRAKRYIMSKDKNNKKNELIQREDLLRLVQDMKELLD